MFLIDYDLNAAIEANGSDSELVQITGNDDTVMQNGFLVAQSEMASYLSQRFDMPWELRDVNIWSNSVAYTVGDRIITVTNGTTVFYTALLAGTNHTPDSSPTYWKAGDDRNPQLVAYGLDIAIYSTFRRINPRYLPDLRVKRYDDAVRWLKQVNEGNVHPILKAIVLSPTSGRMSYGNGSGIPTNF